VGGVKGAAVNTGMSVRLHNRCVTVADHLSEKYFVTRHPQNKTLTAIYMTTLAMNVLYRVPLRGMAVLLAGMRSILNSNASLRSLANSMPKEPRKLLTMYDLDPVTCGYVCCPSCFSLYPHSVTKTQKRKAPLSLENTECHHPVQDPVTASLDNLEYTHLIVPTLCTHRQVRMGSACGESLFDTVIINGKPYVIPRIKYEAQDLKQWIG